MKALVAKRKKDDETAAKRLFEGNRALVASDDFGFLGVFLLALFVAIQKVLVEMKDLNDPLAGLVRCLENAFDFQVHDGHAADHGVFRWRVRNHENMRRSPTQIKQGQAFVDRNTG